MNSTDKNRPQHVYNYCPKCGSAHFIFDGNRSFTCEECKFNLYINSAAAVAAIITNNAGDILLTIRAFEPNKGAYDLPGGFIDPGETAEQALTREIKEELNLYIKDLKYLTSAPNEYVFSGLTIYTLDMGFVCRVDDFSGIHFEDDITGYEFIPADKIRDIEIPAPSIRKILDTYLNE